ELERGIAVTLSQKMPLPDLNSYEPSSYFRQNRPGWLFRWLRRSVGALDLSVRYRAGQQVPAGTYQDVERQIVVQLRAAGALPDLQTGEPSRYRRLRGEKVCVRRTTRMELHGE